jgi:hypothetical protein
VRTLVYNQITSLTTPILHNGAHAPRLSASGNRAVFAFPLSAGGVDHVLTVNADGSTAPVEADTAAVTFEPDAIDITADGSKVVSTDSIQLRFANADGTNRHTLFSTAGQNVIVLARVVANGSQVVFGVSHDANIAGSNAPLQRGLYVINTDGTGLKQIVGPDQILTQLGLAVDDNVFSTANYGEQSFDISADGSHIVFGANIKVAGPAMFGVNRDGSGLHQFPIGQVSDLLAPGISGDGAKVLSYFLPLPCCSTPSELDVFNFDGTGRRALTTAGQAFSDDVLQLSQDGSKLLFGSTGLLFNTDGSGVVQLSALGDSFSGDPPALVTNTMFGATMNATATRFLYISGDANGFAQLATLDINPASPGAAPSITNPTVNPPYLLVSQGSSATISGQVNKASSSDVLVRVSEAVLRNGVQFSDGANRVLLDDGTGHGVFTVNNVTTQSAVVGPRTRADQGGGALQRRQTACDRTGVRAAGRRCRGPSESAIHRGDLFCEPECRHSDDHHFPVVQHRQRGHSSLLNWRWHGPRRLRLHRNDRHADVSRRSNESVVHYQPGQTLAS